MEEMKEMPNIVLEEETEEMEKWRGLNQSEMDLCWKNLAQRMEEGWTSTKSKKAKKEALRGGDAPLECRRVRGNNRYRIRIWGEDCWAGISLSEYNLQRQQSKRNELTEEAEMNQQQKMVIMRDFTRKIRSKGRMGGEADGGSLSCWRQTVKKRGSTGWEDTLQKWQKWLEEMKKKDEKEKMEEMHQHKVEQMNKSAEGLDFCIKITQPTPLRGWSQILEKEEEDASLLHRCVAKRKEWSTRWQCEVENMGDKTLEE